jgi:hypothetical protein
MPRKITKKETEVFEKEPGAGSGGYDSNPTE